MSLGNQNTATFKNEPKSGVSKSVMSPTQTPVEVHQESPKSKKSGGRSSSLMRMIENTPAKEGKINDSIV